MWLTMEIGLLPIPMITMGIIGSFQRTKLMNIEVMDGIDHRQITFATEQLIALPPKSLLTVHRRKKTVICEN